MPQTFHAQTPQTLYASTPHCSKRSNTYASNNPKTHAPNDRNTVRPKRPYAPTPQSFTFHLLYTTHYLRTKTDQESK